MNPYYPQVPVGLLKPNPNLADYGGDMRNLAYAARYGLLSVDPAIATQFAQNYLTEKKSKADWERLPLWYRQGRIEYEGSAVAPLESDRDVRYDP